MEESDPDPAYTEFEATLESLVDESLGLPASDRVAYIGTGLLARLGLGTAPSVPETDAPPPISSQELEELEATLQAAMEAASSKSHNGILMMHAVALELLRTASSTTEPTTKLPTKAEGSPSSFAGPEVLPLSEDMRRVETVLGSALSEAFGSHVDDPLSFVATQLLCAAA